MDINERLETLRAERQARLDAAEDLVCRATNERFESRLIGERIKGIEEALAELSPPTIPGEPYPANGAKKPRRERRDIRGMVRNFLDHGHSRDAAALAHTLNCRVSQVEGALKHIPE